MAVDIREALTVRVHDLEPLSSGSTVHGGGNRRMETKVTHLSARIARRKHHSIKIQGDAELLSWLLATPVGAALYGLSLGTQ